MGVLMTSVVVNAVMLVLVDARSSYMTLNNKPVIDLNKKSAPMTIKAPHERRSALFPKIFTKFMANSNETPKSQYTTFKPSSEYVGPQKTSFNRKEFTIFEYTTPKARETGMKDFFTKIKSNENIRMNVTNVSNLNRVGRRESNNQNSSINEGNIIALKNNFSETANLHMVTENPIENKKLNYKGINNANVDYYVPEVSMGKKNSFLESNGPFEENYTVANGIPNEYKKRYPQSNDDEESTTESFHNSVTFKISTLDEKSYPKNIDTVNSNEKFITEVRNDSEVPGNDKLRFPGSSNALEGNEEFKTEVNGFRQARNVNIIEEESQATVIIPGFRFNDQKPPLENAQTFKNINF
ncbi:unnamed protein product [Diatraea saccharalis]|uniref:Uncharacterized protein n=1 Tax=Diatraea saccharalis TaxID=40085 RepID=A0A9N9N1D1_9NEOP|nr:unnamed protein product [Diatraea saccharalis]